MDKMTVDWYRDKGCCKIHWHPRQIPNCIICRMPEEFTSRMHYYCDNLLPSANILYLFYVNSQNKIQSNRFYLAAVIIKSARVTFLLESTGNNIWVTVVMCTCYMKEKGDWGHLLWFKQKLKIKTIILSCTTSAAVQNNEHLHSKFDLWLKWLCKRRQFTECN